MKEVLVTVSLLLVAAVPAFAQQACPCVPIAKMWTVETCETWNCAAAATIMSNGDPYVLSMPAPTADGRWLVVKRVNAGSYIAAPDAPFVLETFDGADGASARFLSMAGDHAPMILSVPDGRFVVIMARDAVAKKRAAKP
jgi:hypothetical protein